MKLFKLFFVAVILQLFVVSSFVVAGQGYEVVCKNEDCGFKSEVSFGGGKAFSKITGFCVPCDKFVYITWKRNKKEPEPVNYVCDAGSGKTIPLYSCPLCGKPFMPIMDIQELKYCPHCGKETLKRTDNIIMYD